MNVELLGIDLETWANESRKEVGLYTKDESRSAAVGSAVSSGFSALGNVVSSIFRYKTQQLKSSVQQIPDSRTAYTGEPQVPQQSNNNKTLLIVGGTAAAAVLAMAALR